MSTLLYSGRGAPSGASVLPASQMTFSKSDPSQWEHQPTPPASSTSSSASCIFRNKHYSSASEALDAYIRDFEGRSSPQVSHLADIERLLTSKSAGRKSKSKKLTSSTSMSSSSSLTMLDEETRRMIELKRMVEDSYSQLLEQSQAKLSPRADTTDNTVHRVLADTSRVLTDVCLDNTSSLPSASEAAIQPPPPAHTPCHPASLDTDSTATDLLIHAQPYGVEQKVKGHSKGPPLVSAYRNPEMLLSTSQLDSIRGRVQQGYDLPVPQTQERLPSGIDLGRTSEGLHVAEVPSSDTEASSIITGHLPHAGGGNLKKSKHPVSKMASTPKKGGGYPYNHSKTLGFDTSKSSVGPALALEDLKSHSPHASAAHASPPGQRTRHLSGVTTEDIISRSRPMSRAASSRMRSFSAAARLSASNNNPRSDNVNTSSSSSNKTNVSKGSSLGVQPLSPQEPALNGKPRTVQPIIGKGFQDIENAKHKEYLQSLLRDIENSSSSIVTPMSELVLTENQPPQPQPSSALAGHGSPLNKSVNKSVHFWDEEKGAGDATGLTGHKARATSNGAITSPSMKPGLDAGEGFGYLERIQRLITSTPPPQEVTPPEAQPDSASLLLSPDTAAILDGDRSWEKLPPFRVPQYGAGDGAEAGVQSATALAEDLPDPTVDRIVEECVSIVSMHDQEDVEGKPLSGGDQPGGMEALKNMLFTMQSMAEQHTGPPPQSEVGGQSATEPLKKSQDSGLKGSTGMSSFNGDSSGSTKSSSTPSESKKPGEESMQKALEHLSRLKSLVASQGQTTAKGPSPNHRP